MLTSACKRADEGAESPRDFVRFTADDIDQFRSVGLDATGIRTIEDAVARWCDLLEEVRPDVLEKPHRAIAEAPRESRLFRSSHYDGGEQECIENWRMTQRSQP